MGVIKFPSSKIVALNEQNLEAASTFLFDSWHARYRQKLPSSVIEQRSRDFFRRQLRKKIRIAWLALFGSRIVGVVTVSANCIDDIWVNPKYQRRKIGKTLLSTAITHIENKGYTVALAGVEALNKASCLFFKSMGWQQIGSDHIHFSKDTWMRALVYSKKL